MRGRLVFLRGTRSGGVPAAGCLGGDGVRSGGVPAALSRGRWGTERRRPRRPVAGAGRPRSGEVGLYHIFMIQLYIRFHLCLCCSMDETAPLEHAPFLRGDAPVSKHRNHLPHWQQEDCFQFVTWSLGDALPMEARRRIQRERREWTSLHPQPWSVQEEMEYYELFSERVSRWLDAGAGSCLLRKNDYAKVVRDSLLFFEGERVVMDAFVVMPNHVHALFLQKSGWKLETLLQAWKGFSAHELNKRGHTGGTLWMPDYWDRMIRSPEHYWHVRRYILNNPGKAGLSSGFLLWERERPLWVDVREACNG